MDNRRVPREPEKPVEIAAIRTAHAGEICPICQGFGRLKCAACINGAVALLGGVQQCSRCYGCGLRPCQVCHTRGVIPDISENSSPVSASIIS
ncbi:MAG: hypothetical protein ACE5HS_10030 [bacterium]